MRKKLASLTFVMASLVSAASFAWDGSLLTKKISSVELTGGAYNMRVRIDGSPAHCGTSTATWAYLNETDVNYKAITAALLSAKALNQSINLYTTKDASGYCKVGYVTIL